MDFAEFCSMWNYIVQWHQCFKRFDQDNSGNIDKNELKQALLHFGYNLRSEQVLDFIFAVSIQPLLQLWATFTSTNSTFFKMCFTFSFWVKQYPML
jgi:Ca2+-binding EF-hand superfamily protein